MKLINPRGKEVEVDDKRGKRILANKVKVKQGWKPTEKKAKQLANLKQNKPKVAPKKVVKKPTEKKA